MHEYSVSLHYAKSHNDLYQQQRRSCSPKSAGTLVLPTEERQRDNVHCLWCQEMKGRLGGSSVYLRLHRLLSTNLCRCT